MSRLQTRLPRDAGANTAVGGKRRHKGYHNRWQRSYSLSRQSTGQQSEFSGRLKEINSPSGQAKLLQLAPSFSSHKLTLQPTKSISAAAFDVGLVVLSISDPGKHLVRENIPAQGCNLSLDFGDYAKWKKYCAAFISNVIIAQRCVSSDGRAPFVFVYAVGSHSQLKHLRKETSS